MFEILSDHVFAERGPVTRSAIHSGNMGDIIYALPAARALGVDRLALNLVSDPQIGGRNLTREGAEFLLPLLRAQPWLKAVTIGHVPLTLGVGVTPEGRGPLISHGLPLEEVPPGLLGVDIVLDRFRLEPVADLHLIEAHARALNVAIDPGLPFLTIPGTAPEPSQREGLVVSITPRYRHLSTKHLAQILRGFEPILLVGNAQEREAAAGLPGRFVATEDAAALTGLIARSRLFLGVPSLPCALAEGLKHPRLIDIPDWMANAFPSGPDGWLLPPDIDQARALLAQLLANQPPKPAHYLAPRRPDPALPVIEITAGDPENDPENSKPPQRVRGPLTPDPITHQIALPASLPDAVTLVCHHHDHWIKITAITLETATGTRLWQLRDEVCDTPTKSSAGHLPWYHDGALLRGPQHSGQPLVLRWPEPARRTDLRGAILAITLHRLAERDLGQRLLDLATTLDRQQQQCAETQAQLLHCQQEVHHCQQELQAARATLVHVQQSTSWRITAPLRWLITLARRPRAAPATDPATVPVSAAADPAAADPAPATVPILADHADWAAYEPLAERLKQRFRARFEALALPPPALITLEEGEIAHTAAMLAFPHHDAPVVSIVIPAHDAIKYTLECLVSLLEQPAGVDFEVILVDDASTDATQALLATVPGLFYLRNATNQGFLRSCNRAAAVARGRIIVYLNNDAQVSSGWLKPMVAVFDRDDRVAAVGPKIMFPNGVLQEAGCAINHDLSVMMIGSLEDPDLARFGYEREVEYCSGSCLAVDAAKLRAVGLFDETLAPAYCEDMDLCLALRERGWKIIYTPQSRIYHHLSITSNRLGQSWKMARITANQQIITQKWQKQIDRFNDVKLIAFYLPQYHPIPENDRWWGQGFTEWHNVSKALPNFVGHYQPHMPAELGFYDLRVPEVMAQQAELAQLHGISGFCFYYYWFAGKRLLERPLEQILETNIPDIPFCLCWANENWTRRWDGLGGHVLINQEHSDADDEAVMHDLIRYFRHPNYIRIDGKPFFAVYRPSLFPDIRRTAARWRDLCRAQGIGEIYLSLVESFAANGDMLDPARIGFDASIEFPSHTPLPDIPLPAKRLRPEFSGKISDYRELVVTSLEQEHPPWTRFRSVIPCWDNTARRQDHGYMLAHSSPGAYQFWLEEAIAQTRAQNFGEERMVFINAWNEWGEGNHLEPDRRYGRAFLEATRNARERWAFRRRTKFWS